MAANFQILSGGKRSSNILRAFFTESPNPFIISDPIYKMLGGKNENSAGDINAMMDQLEDLVQRTKGANAFGHHFTKGNQSDKEAIDRASGLRSFSTRPRYPHYHDQTSNMISATCTNYIVRNHIPVTDRVMEWKYPLFILRSHLNPQDLKPRGAPFKIYLDQLADVLGPRSMPTKAFQRRASNEIGITSSTFYLLIRKPRKPKPVKNPISE